MMADAQQSSEIVLGRLLVSLVPATVLFDSRASHSFISQSFASAHDLQSDLLPSPLAIHTPGSRCSSSVFVPDVVIRIQGVAFSASLVVLPRSDIDVILGMDWLVKHKAIINCPSRSVELLHESGTDVVYSAGTALAYLNALNAVVISC